MKRLGRMLGLLVVLGWFSSLLQAQEITGIWQATIPGQVKERLVLTITKSGPGVLSSQIYAVDHVRTFLGGSTVFAGNLLKLSVPSDGWIYEGQLSSDGKTISGTWKWNATSAGFPLSFERATKEANWGNDTTPHKVSFVAVAPGVKLEVLDWGGTGTPLVLLTGLNDNAHIFDLFAPKLAAKYHVYGITRRGFGASDSPPPVWENYSADRLGDDVLAVIEELKLQRPVVAGHSIAGEELSSIGSRHPERVAGLIYLDAGYGFAMYVRSQDTDILDWDDMRNKVNAITNASTPQEQKALIQAMLQTELPQYEQELKDRQTFLQNLPDEAPPSVEKLNSSAFKISQAILDGEERYTKINGPVLALFREPIPAVLKTDSQAPTTKAQAARDADLAKGIKGEANAFRALGPQVRVVMLPGADHYVFRSNEADVLREVDAFMTILR